MNALSAFWFTIREFCRVRYFIFTMVTTTVSVVLTQWLAYRAWGGNISTLYLRSAFIGMWSTSVFATGALGFERRKKTLTYLISGSKHPLCVLAGVIGAASTVGLLSFPLSWLLWCLFTQQVVPPLNGGFLLLFWISCLVVSLVLGTFFIMTPVAITYEGLLTIPILFASGIVIPLSFFWMPLATLFRILIPLCVPVEFSYGVNNMPILPLWGSYVVSLMLWVTLAFLCYRKAYSLAVKQGTLELI